MNYNYPQPQYQAMAPAGYRQPIQTPYSWNQVPGTTPQVRPVSSIEEVRACPIDFDGSVFYFADMANKRIYTKQINIDGTASINLYELKEFPTIQQPDQLSATSYVTKEEFENTIIQLKNMYEQLLNEKLITINNNTTVPTAQQIIQQEVDQTPAAQETTTQKIPQFSF